MKPPLLLSILFSIGTLCTNASESSTTEIFSNLRSGTKQTVVIYGTSLSHGGQWAREVQRWFDARYPGLVRFQNSSGPGQNSDWGLRNLSAGVLRHHPDLVFLEFSYNDCVDRFKMPVERGASNLASIVEQIRAQNPKTTVVLQTMNVGWDAPNGNRSASIRSRLEAFNDNYRSFAREQGLPLLDHYSNWLRLKESDPRRFETLVPDGSHPTPEGSLLVTWPAVRDWLEKMQAAPISEPKNQTVSPR